MQSYAFSCYLPKFSCAYSQARAGENLNYSDKMPSENCAKVTNLQLWLKYAKNAIIYYLADNQQFPFSLRFPSSFNGTKKPFYCR